MGVWAWYRNHITYGRGRIVTAEPIGIFDYKAALGFGSYPFDINHPSTYTMIQRWADSGLTLPASVLDGWSQDGDVRTRELFWLPFQDMKENSIQVLRAAEGANAFVFSGGSLNWKTPYALTRNELAAAMEMWGEPTYVWENPDPPPIWLRLEGNLVKSGIHIYDWDLLCDSIETHADGGSPFGDFVIGTQGQWKAEGVYNGYVARTWLKFPAVGANWPETPATIVLRLDIRNGYNDWSRTGWGIDIHQATYSTGTMWDLYNPFPCGYITHAQCVNAPFPKTVYIDLDPAQLTINRLTNTWLIFRSTKDETTAETPWGSMNRPPAPPGSGSEDGPSYFEGCVLENDGAVKLHMRSYVDYVSQIGPLG